MLLKNRPLRPSFVLVLVAGAVVACGARTDISSMNGDAGVTGRDADGGRACAVSSDCPGFEDKCVPVTCEAAACVRAAPVACDDADPCTTDACEPPTGTCAFTPRSFDLDKDGHRGPIPGMTPGSPGSCGDDCDDASALAFPGGVELCDGVDNDCNGIVDDRARYVPVGATEATRVSTNALSVASPSGIAHNGESFFTLYDGTAGGKTRLFATAIDVDGAVRNPERRLTQVESDASGASIAWTGDRYGVVWSDRRDNNYEVYFATFDTKGQKLAPGDVRVTDTEGFSVNVSLAWTGAEFVAVWQDEGERSSSARFRVYGQRITLQGALAGGNVALSPETVEAESPGIAVGKPTLGMTWVTGATGNQRVVFAPFTFDLRPVGTAVFVTEVGRTGVFPQVVWNQTDFALAWYENDPNKRTVWGSVIDGRGIITTPAKILSDSSRQARDPSLLPLGDRLLLVYADSRDQNSGYELYTRMLSHSLDATLPSERITRAVGDSVAPVTAFGPKGEVGVLFRDDRQSSPQVFFTHLECRAN